MFKKPREVVHKNTRFVGDPFSRALNKSQLQQAAALNAQVGWLRLLQATRGLTPKMHPGLLAEIFVNLSFTKGIKFLALLAGGRIDLFTHTFRHPPVEK